MEVVEHPNCPICGKGVGEMHKLNNEEVEKGNKSKDLKFIPVAEVGIHVNFDPTHLPIIGGTIAARRSYKDVCEECGAVWAFRVERGEATFTGDMRQPFKDFK